MRSEMAMRPRAATPGAWPDNLNGKEVIQHMENTTATGFVYFIRAVGTSRIKLGFSAEPEKRLRELQTASPNRLVLLAKWPGTVAIERQLHKEFAEYRVRGEWFKLPRPLIEQLLGSAKPVRSVEKPNTEDLRLWRLTTYRDRHGKVRVRKILRFVPAPGVTIELGVITEELAAELKAQRGKGRWKASRLEAQALRVEALAIAGKHTR